MGKRGGALGGGGSASAIEKQLQNLVNSGKYNNHPAFGNNTSGSAGGGGGSSSGSSGTGNASTGGVSGGGGGGGFSSSSTGLSFDGWTAGQKKIYYAWLAKGDKAAAKAWYEAVTKSVKANKPSPPPSGSSGSKPGSFDTSKVNLQPGTSHTPLLPQSKMAAKLPDALFGDRTAPLGSADNPHVFDNSSTATWQTFGAMHTNQSKAAWDSPAAWQHAYDYTAGTFEYNHNSAPDAGSPIGTPGKDNKYTLGLDEAFQDSAVKPFEEHVVLVSSQDIMFFAGANGISIPDMNSPGQNKNFAAKKSMDVDDIANDLEGLKGQELIYTNFMSTAIPVDQTFNKYSNNIRVLVKMKPGQKGVYVSGNPTNVLANPTLKSSPISAFNTGEKEFILPRNQKYKIVAVEPHTQGIGKYDLDVVIEIVEQPSV